MKNLRNYIVENQTINEVEYINVGRQNEVSTLDATANFKIHIYSNDDPTETAKFSEKAANNTFFADFTTDNWKFTLHDIEDMLLRLKYKTSNIFNEVFITTYTSRRGMKGNEYISLNFRLESSVNTRGYSTGEGVVDLHFEQEITPDGQFKPVTATIGGIFVSARQGLTKLKDIAKYKTAYDCIVDLVPKYVNNPVTANRYRYDY